eukprot:3432686-Pleurochrysis_carterae.AAC.1
MRSRDSSDGGDQDGGARGERVSSSREAEGELMLALMGIALAGGRWHARIAMARRGRVGAAVRKGLAEPGCADAWLNESGVRQGRRV